jgi:hypothetical protein
MKRCIRKYFKADYVILAFGLILIAIVLTVLLYDCGFFKWLLYGEL